MNNSSEKEFFLKKAKVILKEKGFTVNESKFFNGSFGYVFLIKDQDGTDLAAKAISLNNYSQSSQADEKLLQAAQSEAKIMQDNQHENIIILVDSFQQGSIFFIIMEQAQMTLEEYQQNNLSNQRISEEQFFNLAGQMVDGISFLHSKNIILRDLKPSNVLMLNNGKLKLSDFGLCKQFKSSFDINQYKQSSIKGSYMFYPPEIMSTLNDNKTTEQYLKSNPIQQTFKGDVWALGISLLSLLGVKPFASIALSCGYTSFENDPNVSEKINTFLKQLLQKEFQKRPSISVVKKLLREASKQYNSLCLITEGIILRDKELNFDEANELFEQSIEKDPNNSMGYFHLALSYFRQDDDERLLEKMKKNLNIALKLNPQNENFIGLQSELIENSQNKYSMLKKALNINKFNSYVLNLLGKYHKQQKNYEQTEKFHKLAIKYNINFGRSYYFLGIFYSNNKQFEMAIQMFKLGIGRDMTDSLIFTELGKLYCDGINEVKQGEHYLEIAVRSNSRDLISKFCLGKQYKKSKKLQQSLEIFQELISIIPKQDYFDELHQILFSLEMYEECEKQALRSAEINKKFFSYFNLAQISARLNKKQQLIESYDKGMLIEPNDGLHYASYGEFLEEVGDLQNALDKFTKSSSLGENCVSEIERLKRKLQKKN